MTEEEKIRSNEEGRLQEDSDKAKKMYNTE